MVFGKSKTQVLDEEQAKWEWHKAFAIIPHSVDEGWVWFQFAERRKRFYCGDYWEWRISQ